MKKTGEIEHLLQHYDAVCSVLENAESPRANRLKETLHSSISQIRSLRAQTPCPVPRDKIRTGLRQGLRDMPHVLEPLFDVEKEAVKKQLTATLSDIAAEFRPAKR